MSRERRERIVETLFQIRPGELRLTSLLFTQCLFVVGTFIVGRSARDAIFLANAPRERLPVMYIVSALAVAAVGFAYSRLADRARRDVLSAGTAALFAAGFAAMRAALGTGVSWSYSTFYVFVEVVGALTVIQFWTLANDLFNARDAKRLFGIIGAGGTLANVVFGGAVGAFARRLGAENLALACGLLLLLVAGLALLLGRRAPARVAHARPAPRASRPGASKLFASNHLKYVAGLSAFTFLTTTLIDFQFKTIAAGAFDKNALAAFFGNFYAATGVLALFVQFFATSRVLSRFGVIAALAILPAFLGLGSVTMLLFPVLWAATFTKGSEFVFRYTIHDATTQLLYLPVPAATRAGAKAFIDGVVKPGAIALSGALLLGYRAWAGSRLAPIAAASAACAVAWCLLVYKLRGEYVRSLQDTLRRRTLDLEGAAGRIEDGKEASRLLLRALESPNPQEILTALELLPRSATGRCNEQVVVLLAHPEAQVRRAALRHLGACGSLQHGVAVLRLFEDPLPEVRAAAIEAFCAIGREKSVRYVRGLLADTSPETRAAAIVGVIRHGGLDGLLAAAKALESLCSDPAAQMRIQAAKVLGAIGARNFYQPVLELMHDPEPAVRRAAIQAAAELRAPELVLPLVYKLASQEGLEAVDALAAFGASILPTLDRVLGNPREEPEIRCNAARVLGKLATPEAIAVLGAHLDDPDELVRRILYKALKRALRRQRGSKIDPKLVRRAIDRELERAYHALCCAEALGLQGPPDATTPRAGPQAAAALLSSALAEKVEQCVGRVFVLLGIVYPDAELELVWAGFKDASAQDAPRRRANALELLENVLDRSLRRRLFPLLEDFTREARLREAARIFELPSFDPAARLCDLLADESAWVRSCALFLHGEHPSATPLTAVTANLDHSSATVREAALVALEKQLPLPDLLRALEQRPEDGSELVRARVRAIRGSAARLAS